MTDWKLYIRPGVANIEPYVPGLTDDELKRRYGLKRVIKLNANENALGPSPLALRAIQEELSALHHYPDGSSELLRGAIAGFHGVGTEQVLVGNGSDEIIKLLSETFLEPGDRIVVPSPSFSQYSFGAAVMRASVIEAPLADDFAYDVEALAEAVTKDVKMVYICSPNNPTGTVMTATQLDWLLKRLPESVVVVLDLAYNDYSARGDRVTESPELLSDPRVVVLHTFSKLYGLAGLRVGYGLAHPDLWGFVNRVREPFNVNRLAQRAAAAALADSAHRLASQRLVEESKRFYEQSADALGMLAIPTEGNFVFLRTGAGGNTMRALMQQGVMVRTGFPGAEDYVRITFGTAEENEACVSALHRVRSATV